MVSGAARVGGRAVKLQDARLSGEDLRFSFTADVNGAPVKHEFTGKVEGDAINGSVVLSGARVQGQQEWNARRSGRCRRGGSARGAFRGRCAWLPACPVDAESDRHGARGRLRCAALSALPAAGPAFAQEKDLDTPYVQTPQNVVDKMLEIAKVGADDYVIDLGSGDGRMVITAAKKLRRARLRGGPRPAAGGAGQPQCREGRRREAAPCSTSATSSRPMSARRRC